MKSAFFLAAFVVFAAPSHAEDLLKQFPVRKPPAKAARQAQGKVALKSAFPTVSAQQLPRAIAATNLAAATKSIGKNALFVGVVTDVFTPRSGSIVLLNFAPNYKNAVVGAVKAADFGKFPPLQALKNKKVALTGRVVSYRGSPEIELTRVGAIRVVK